MFRANFSGVDSLVSTARYTRHIFLDVEPSGANFALVFRGEDKARIGQTLDPTKCAFYWNDTTGAHKAHVIAVSDDKALAATVCSELSAFYKSGESEVYSSRLAKLCPETLTVLVALIPILGIDKPVGKVASFNEIRDKENAKRAEDIAAARKLLAEAAAQESILKAQQSSASAPADPMQAQQAIIDATMAAIGTVPDPTIQAA